MIDFTLIYQILVLLMLGVEIGLLSHLVRRNIHPKEGGFGVTQGDTNVSLKADVHQGDRNVTIPPLQINANPQEEHQQHIPPPPSIPLIPRPNFTPYAGQTNN